jgi:hypothetical protein
LSGCPFQAFLLHGSSLLSFIIFFPSWLFFSSLSSFLRSSFSLFPPHRSQTEVNQCVLRAVDNLLWNYCKLCKAGISHLSLFLASIHKVKNEKK